MEEKIWFFLEGENVSGPHSVSEIGSLVENKSKVNLSFWIRGQTEWVNYEQWQSLVKEHESKDVRAQAIQDRLWKIRIDGQQEKQLPHKQLIEVLKNFKDLASVQIWTEGYTEWKEVYQIHKIMDELGVSRRAHPRVPIMGELIVEIGGKEYAGKILTISEGGCGATGVPELKIGDKMKITIKSQQLFTTVHASAEVLYVSTGSYVGCKFVGLASESKNAIVEYVKKFTSDNNQTLKDT